MSQHFIKLSKTISHALRHEPEAYNLELNQEGWVDLSQLVHSLRNKGWKNLQQEDILSVVETAEKKRFQILNDKIRAYYGHSFEEKIIKQSQVPPDILYHGTIIESLDSILALGLLPMNRQYVHLSEDQSTAEIVAGRRKNSASKILTIQARQAYDSGIAFYKEENSIWLSEPIPPAFIKM